MVDKLVEYIKDVRKKGHVMENGVIHIDNEQWSYKVKKLKNGTKRN